MSLVAVIGSVRPDEIYNLAAQSHVQVSFDVPEFTADVDATGVLRVLEAVRLCGLADTCRVYQASTSELYGKVEEVPQNEKRRSIRTAPMRWPNSTVSGSPRSTVKHITCSAAPAFCSTMNPSAAAKLL